MAGWSNEQCLYQLKAHLSGTALRVLQIMHMPETEKKLYELAVAALQKRFCCDNIEELRGFEFRPAVR